MKSIKITLGLLLAVGSVFVSCKKETTEVKVDQTTSAKKPIANAETTSFNIEGMTCAIGCAKTIETKLSGLEGVQKATVDFDKKTATVEYDPAVQSPEKLATFVEAVADGKTYKVSNVKSSADKAMLYQEKPTQEKTKKKTKKTDDEASASATPKATAKKAGCCAGKKACTEKKEPGVM
jgi:copper chaperone CopZ